MMSEEEAWAVFNRWFWAACASIIPDFTHKNWFYTQIGQFFMFQLVTVWLFNPVAGVRWTGPLHKLVFMFWTMMVCFYMCRENRLYESAKLPPIFGIFWLITDRVIHDEGMRVQMQKYGWISFVFGDVPLLTHLFAIVMFFMWLLNTVFSWIFSWLMS